MTFPKAGIAVALALALAACGERLASPPSPFKSTDISSVGWGRDFQLTDHNGQARSLADFRGKVVLLYFGFTHCPDVCPKTMAEMAHVVDRLGAGGARVQGLFVTVDPRRDTPQVLVYLGQLERILSNDKQALIHFRAALTAKPDQKQAAIEIQQIEDKALEKSGFGLFKKK